MFTVLTSRNCFYPSSSCGARRLHFTGPCLPRQLSLLARLNTQQLRLVGGGLDFGAMDLAGSFHNFVQCSRPISVPFKWFLPLSRFGAAESIIYCCVVAVAVTVAAFRISDGGRTSGARTSGGSRKSDSSFRGVCERPSDTFYAEIRSSDTRLDLDAFDTADEAARAYDRLAPPPRVATEEDRRQNRRRERCLGMAEMGEHAMAAWRQQFPSDVLDERAFFAQRRTERAAYREDRSTWKQAALFNMELKRPSTWDSDDE
ncbi:hypothetical protein ZWY2020_009136 [Hordeum vulgare]|nr:hypothetical protein ZWY2020_009136 [Hordeum vulgare]